MNHFLVLLVVVFLVHVFSVGGANPKYRQVKYCNITVNKSFTCGESEYKCQYRCTVNSKYNLYSVRRINSSFYRCVFHLCANETVGCQEHICYALRAFVPFFKKREKHPWSSATFSKVAKACNFTKNSVLLHSLFYVF